MSAFIVAYTIVLLPKSIQSSTSFVLNLYTIFQIFTFYKFITLFLEFTLLSELYKLIHMGRFLFLIKGTLSAQKSKIYFLKY